MADFITKTIGESLTGTSANDNMTFGVQAVDGVAFVATGSLSGGGGDDAFFTLDARALFNGVQYVYGNEGNDAINLGGLFTAYGGKGNDSINEIAVGALPPASQQFFGGEGADTIFAGGGNDYIEGNEGTDFISAGDDSDFVWGGKENDTIFGGFGFDTIYGNLGNDLIFGGDNVPFPTPIGLVNFDAADSINGGQGNDTIFGELGNDTIIGGVGSDSIIGNSGNDILTGATGNNVFRYGVFNAGANGFLETAGSDNTDRITDFVSGTDDLSFAVGPNAVFAGLNFTAATTYSVNTGFPIAAIDLTAAGNNADYAMVYTTLAANLPVIAASNNANMEVLNLLVRYQGTNTNFVLCNNGDTFVSEADVLIEGFHVASPAPTGDIGFS